jgi:predicted secreted protein
MATLTPEQNGKTVSVEMGSTVRLVLPNPGSGGYLIEGTPDFDADVLSLEETRTVRPGDSAGAGNFGRLEWTFTAVGGGPTELAVRAKRPWEKEPVLLFLATVIVREQ